VKNERNQTQIKTDQHSLVPLLSNSATMHHANEVTGVVLRSRVQAWLNILATSALDRIFSFTPRPPYSRRNSLQ